MCINYISKRNRSQQWLVVLVSFAYLCTFFYLAYPQESLQAKGRKNFLWSIETGKNTVYLLGSLHILKSDSFPLGKEIEDAYIDSKKIVLEADLGSVNNPEFQAKMITLGLYPEGQTLAQNVSKETYRLFEKKLIAVGLPVAQFSRLRPWVCALALTLVEFQRLGFDPNYGIDTHFFNKAKKDGKEIIALETMDYQLGLFTKMGKAEQESFLRQALKDLEVIETMASEMVSSWKTGDVDKLNSIINLSFKAHPDIYNRFIIQRNKRWISRIEGLMRQDENVLVIVGAGHLVGTENILELLKKRGYKILRR
jgi:hypothetical protein